VIAIGTVLAAILVSLLVTRVAAIALSVTGLSRESARFQARSAFTGVGFTTSEAESVVNHPVRRRIVLILMLLGNAGLVTIIASLLLSFTGATDSTQAWHRIGLLLGGLVGIVILANSRIIDRAITRAITWLLHRFTDLDVRDYAALLQLSSGFGVIELEIGADHWTEGRTLEELQLRKEGVAVLGIEKKRGSFVGVPNGSSVIEEGDTLLVYGHTRTLSELGTRKKGQAGDEAHRTAVLAHEGPDTGKREEGARHG
jgi:K+/H+ antiporter YhaU regulatory subunit KhtT